MIKLVTSEKAVRLIELNNTLVFETDMRKDKKGIKKEIETTFNIEIDKINTLIRRNKKYVYVKLNPKNPAIDVATKLGMI
ncbi:MAG: 50S ribosomal protein L23 [Nanoarchaeota archaeon]